MLHATHAADPLTRDRPPTPSWLEAIEGRWPGAGRRVAGFTLALLLEAALLLLLLTLGQSGPGAGKPAEALATFTATPDAPDDPETAEPESVEPPEENPIRAPTARPPDEAREPLPSPVPTAPAPVLIPLSRSEMASADIRPVKPQAPPTNSGPVGPRDSGAPGDSQRVAGSGPNGEPLYAARWFREPYDDELRGYLSTAHGPGWALINCRTVPEFRVEDCVLEAEQPSGSNIGPAVLAAAWQFKVRPPRLGGRSMVGEWVRIRIDYQLRPRSASTGG